MCLSARLSVLTNRHSRVFTYELTSGQVLHGGACRAYLYPSVCKWKLAKRKFDSRKLLRPYTMVQNSLMSQHEWSTFPRAREWVSEWASEPCERTIGGPVLCGYILQTFASLYIFQWSIFCHRKPNSGLESNYCRNPSKHKNAWCYVKIEGGTQWADCRVQMCDGWIQPQGQISILLLLASTEMHIHWLGSKNRSRVCWSYKDWLIWL